MTVVNYSLSNCMLQIWWLFRRAHFWNEGFFENLSVLSHSWQVNQGVYQGIAKTEPAYHSLSCGTKSLVRGERVVREVAPNHCNHNRTPTDIVTSHHAKYCPDRSFLSHNPLH